MYGLRTSTCEVPGLLLCFNNNICLPKIFQHRTFCDETYKSAKSNTSLVTDITYCFVSCNTFLYIPLIMYANFCVLLVAARREGMSYFTIQQTLPTLLFLSKSPLFIAFKCNK